MPRLSRASLDAQRLAYVPRGHAPRAEPRLRRFARAPVVVRARARRVPNAHALRQQRRNRPGEHVAAAARAHAIAARDVHRHVLAVRDHRRRALEQHACVHIGGKLLRQLAVLISRNFQLIWNQKLTLGSLILQAPLMVLVIKLVGEPDCFTSNLINIGSRTVLFIVCAMASFMGLLNSYREICKDREIIFREASVGVSLLATVLSKAITLFLVEAVQAGILTAGFVEIIHIPQNHLLLDTNVEIFITIFLLMAASSAMGLLVSASLKSSEAAVLLVLVLIIGQVVFSGVMFSMTGALTAISYIIVCRWGMGALGASTDLNDRLSWLKAGLDSPMYDATVPNLVHSWQMLGLITLVCVAAAWLVLYIGFNRKKG